MHIIDIIAKKRDKGKLNHQEISYFIDGVTNNTIPDYQISALLMAMFLNGMSEEEITDLTLCMAKSGDMLDLSPLGDKTVDKHSTGGVGDKTTLVVAPIASALGCTVAKMSGRGLGFTGGTVDKLESITGYRTSITPEEFMRNAKNLNICLTGHSGNLAPADKRLYAIRDVTSTVESIPLIASSIMSKKLAAGAKNIVLDVKCGKGAFMKTPETAEALAKEMLKIGKNAGRNMTALITNMDVPLGNAVGNSIEVKEAVSVLNGEGPQELTELCLALAANMVCLCYHEEYETSLQKVKSVINDGSALEKLCQLISAQGGDQKLITGEKEFPAPESELKIYAPTNGFVSEIDSELVGKAAGLSGAGRITLDDKIDFSAGILLDHKYSDYVNQDELIATIFGKRSRLKEAGEVLSKAFAFSDTKPQPIKLIYKTL